MFIFPDIVRVTLLLKYAGIKLVSTTLIVYLYKFSVKKKNERKKEY